MTESATDTSHHLEMADRYSAFSIDAILASDCSRSPGGVVGDCEAVVGECGDGGHGSLNLSVDDTWLRQLFNDVARRLVACSDADPSRRSSSLHIDKELRDTETEPYTNNIWRLVESDSSCWQRFPVSSVDR